VLCNVITFQQALWAPLEADASFMPLRYNHNGSRLPIDRDTDREAVREVILWARLALNSEEDVAISVTAHECGDAKCDGTTTMILLLRANQPTQSARIRKPLKSVTREDVARALGPFRLQPASIRSISRSGKGRARCRICPNERPSPC
jgi:hypothetical protein